MTKKEYTRKEIIHKFGFDPKQYKIKPIRKELVNPAKEKAGLRNLYASESIHSVLEQVKKDKSDEADRRRKRAEELAEIEREEKNRFEGAENLESTKNRRSQNQMTFKKRSINVISNLKLDAKDKIMYIKYNDTIVSGKFKFECKRCGQCCLVDPIGLTEKDISRIANYFNMESDLFKEQYVKSNTQDNKKKYPEYMYAWKESTCPFFDKEKGCKIYQIRPIICKKFPDNMLNDTIYPIDFSLTLEIGCQALQNKYDKVRDAAETHQYLMKRVSRTNPCDRRQNKDEDILFYQFLFQSY